MADEARVNVVLPAGGEADDNAHRPRRIVPAFSAPGPIVDQRGPIGHQRGFRCQAGKPLPGNGISRAEKKAPIRRPNHRSPVSETQWSYKNPPNRGLSHACRKSPQLREYVVGPAEVALLKENNGLQWQTYPRGHFHPQRYFGALANLIMGSPTPRKCGCWGCWCWPTEA